MKQSAKILLAQLALCAVATTALAESSVEQLVQACIACHGEFGAKPIANYPILAGQHKKYLLHALKSYKNGRRANAIMQAQMAPLDAKHLPAIADYFAQQKSPLR